MYVVLVYDISQEKNGAKRWSKVFKISKKYLSHIQNSVFEGEISKPQLEQLQQEMKPYIDTELDWLLYLKADKKSGWTRNFGVKKRIKQVFSFKPLKYRICDKAQEEIRNWNGIYNGLCTMDCNHVLNIKGEIQNEYRSF